MAPCPKRGNMGEVPGDKELFGVQKAAVWRTRRQVRKFLQKGRKEKEAGEEREGDNDHHDAEAEDGDGDGDGVGDGGDEGNGPRPGKGALGDDRDEGMRVDVARVEGERVVGEGVVVGKGEGGG